MNLSLTVVGGVHHGKMIPLMSNEFRIGRDPSCHLRPASEEVGRRHCAVVVHPSGTPYLRDYGEGTLINHRTLINGELRLEDGDLIEVGPLAFRIQIKEFVQSMETTVGLPLTATEPIIELPSITSRGPIKLPGISSVMTELSSSIPPSHPREESALESSSLSDSNIFNIRRHEDLVDLLIDTGKMPDPQLRKVTDEHSKLVER